MILNWQKKGFWSPKYYVLDGQKILWQLEGADLFTQQPSVPNGGVSLHCQGLQGKTEGGTIDLTFAVAEARSGEALAQVHVGWSMRDMLNIASKPDLATGSIVSKNGDKFGLTIHRSWKPSECSVSAVSPTKHITAKATKTVETNMDISDKLAAAVLLTPLLSLWFQGPFKMKGG